MTRPMDSKALRLVLFLMVFSVAFAGVTNFNALQIDPTQGETNSLLINNSSGTAQVTVTAAGAVTLAGTLEVTGAQTFTASAALNGGAVLADTKDLTCGADAGCDIGASATEFGTIWVQTLDDGDGTVAVAAALTVAGNATVTGDVLPEADGTRSLGASGTEFGTAWVQTLDDGDGTVAVAANLDVTAGTVALGTNVPTMAVAKTVFLPASSAFLSMTGAAELKNGKQTIALADAAADEHMYFAWGIPDDLDDTADVNVVVQWLCDDATVTEGLWNASYLAVAPDDADAALTTGLTVLDTAVQDQWMQTGALVVPNAAIGATDTVLHLDIFHDISDPLCNAQDVNVAGIWITYTTDKNY